LSISRKYTITGASGWLGREFIYFLFNNSLVSSLEEFQLFASKDKKLNFGEFGIAQARSLLDTPEKEVESTEYFVHLAFLTRDKIPQYGLNRYIEINEALTDKSIFLISQCKPRFIINVSSGAVFDSKSKELSIGYAGNPYGFGKLGEERKLIETSLEISANIIIGRLWGCTGRYMPINLAYAISDLIYSALTKREMNVNSAHQVWRRYVDAGEFMYLLSQLVRSESSLLLDSGGEIIEIGELARLISEQLGKIQLNRPPLAPSKIDDYYPKSNEFNLQAQRLGVNLANLETQVSRTIMGHRSQLDFG